jgi:hypothetical protein
MKKILIVVIIGLAFLLSLALTNPEKDDFYRFLRKKIQENQEKTDNKFKLLFRDVGVEAKMLGMKLSTKRVDYGLFSIFKNSFNLDQDKYDFKVLGFWKGVFISLP